MLCNATRLLSVMLILASSVGCYTVRLSGISAVPGERLGPTATIEVPPETARFQYDVRSFAAGIANRWRIDVGRAVEQYAEAYLRPLFPEGNDLRIDVSLEGFDVRDFEAHVDVRCAVFEGNDLLMNNKYHGSGIGHFAQTAWGGPFAMKSSMRKTTNEALRDVFEQIRVDLNELCDDGTCS